MSRRDRTPCLLCVGTPRPILQFPTHEPASRTASSGLLPFLDIAHPSYQPPATGPATRRALGPPTGSADDYSEARLERALAIAFEEYGAYTGEFGIRQSAEMPIIFGDELRRAVCEFTRAERERGILPEHVIIELRRLAGQVYDRRRAPDAFGRVVEKCVRWIVEEYYAIPPAARRTRAD